MKTKRILIALVLSATFTVCMTFTSSIDAQVVHAGRIYVQGPSGTFIFRNQAGYQLGYPYSYHPYFAPYVKRQYYPPYGSHYYPYRSYYYAPNYFRYNNRSRRFSRRW